MNDLFNMLENDRPASWIWQPQPDITAYEVAQCIPAFYFTDIDAMDYYVRCLSPKCKRHFKEI